jgi:four helix bundle protein
MRGYQNLIVWQKSMDLVEVVYHLVKVFPADERFALTSQVRRAVTSIPANITEGYGRIHRREYIHHVSIARGSLMELETHLMVAQRLAYVSEQNLQPVWNVSQSVGRLLSALLAALQKDNPDSQQPDK